VCVCDCGTHSYSFSFNNQKKETKRRGIRDGKIGKGQIGEGGCEETFHCLGVAMSSKRRVRAAHGRHAGPKPTSNVDLI
jgi:hypothetical protein